MARSCWVYIMASLSRTLYVGMTRNLLRRVGQHRAGKPRGFTAGYRVNRLVYYEEARSVKAALERERQIKRWRRGKKIELIERFNAGWLDLSRDWPVPLPPGA
jgi:putative endonuclease